MKIFIFFMFRGLLASVFLVAVLWVVGPYEPADLATDFDATQLAGGVDPYLAAQEARFNDISQGVEKQVIWTGEPEEKADWAVLYLHGFSATAQEIRPVPDDVARALGATLVFTRLAGHGRTGDAMAGPVVNDWMNDVAEGIAIARKTGNRVLIIATSTGATLAAAAAMDDVLMQEVAGIVMISPNFGVQNPLGALLNWPAARYWLPVLAGKHRSWEPRNTAHGTYWTTRYPSVAALPMAALIKAVEGLDLGQARVPALFIYSQKDTVVKPEMTERVAQAWGGPSDTVNPVLTAQDDPDAHVIAGDIMSPAQTAPTTQAILEWAKGL